MAQCPINQIDLTKLSDFTLLLLFFGSSAVLPLSSLFKYFVSYVKVENEDNTGNHEYSIIQNAIKMNISRLLCVGVQALTHMQFYMNGINNIIF